MGVLVHVCWPENYRGISTVTREKETYNLMSTKVATIEFITAQQLKIILKDLKKVLSHELNVFCSHRRSVACILYKHITYITMFKNNFNTEQALLYNTTVALVRPEIQLLYQINKQFSSVLAVHSLSPCLHRNDCMSSWGQNQEFLFLHEFGKKKWTLTFL